SWIGRLRARNWIRPRASVLLELAVEDWTDGPRAGRHHPRFERPGRAAPARRQGRDTPRGRGILPRLDTRFSARIGTGPTRKRSAQHSRTDPTNVRGPRLKRTQLCITPAAPRRTTPSARLC